MSYDSTVLADGPVMFLECEEPSGFNALDATGNLHAGTYSGTFALGATGIGDGKTAVTLDGATGIITVPASAALRPASVSAEAWVFPTSPNNGAGIVLANTFLAHVGFELGLDPSGAGTFVPGFGSYDGATWHVATDGGGVLPLNRWCHLVGTYDGANLGLYRNGTLVGGPTPWAGPLAYDTTNLVVGERHDGVGSPFFAGTVAKVAVYNYALSPTQVTSHFSAATAQFGGPQPPVLGVYVRRMGS